MARLSSPRSFAAAGQFGWWSALNWGHGMIGKATVTLVALLGLLSIIAYRVPTEFAMLAIAGAAVFVVIVYLFFLCYFARYHPALAATEGPTYVQTQQLDYAAKGMAIPLNAPVGPDPQNPTLIEAKSNG